MADTEIAASIDLGDLGLGAAGAGGDSYQQEMVSLLREMRDAMVEQSRISRSENFFAGGFGATFAKIFGSMAGVLGILSGEAWLSERPGGTILPPKEALDPYGSNGKLGNERTYMGTSPYKSNEENIIDLIEDQIKLKEEYQKIIEDGIITDDERVKLQEILTFLTEDQKLLKEKMLDDEKESFSLANSMIEANSNIKTTQEDINDALKDGKYAIENQVTQQKGLTQETLRTLAAQLKLNAARGRGRTSIAPNVGGVMVSPTVAGVQNLTNTYTSSGTAPLTPSTGYYQFG